MRTMTKKVCPALGHSKQPDSCKVHVPTADKMPSACVYYNNP